MFCIQCRTKIDPAAARYCHGCGHPIRPMGSGIAVPPVPARNPFAPSSLEYLKSRLFRAVGIVLMLVALATAAWRAQFLQDAVTADGVVSRDEFGNGTHLGIDFITASGEHRSFSQSAFIVGHYVGERVRVLYRPEGASDACLASFGALWGLPVMVFAMGASFFLLGTEAFVAWWKPRTRQRGRNSIGSN
jgi:hypothetical protein